MLEDSLYKYLSVYAEMPPAAKYISGKLYLMIPPLVRYGTSYLKFKHQLLFENSASFDKLNEFKLDKFRKTLKCALESTPYYKINKEKYNIKIRDYGDIQKLPFLTKSDLRENNIHFISDRFKLKSLIKISTGGSTAEPLLLYYPKGIIRTREYVYLNDLFGRIGYKPGDRTAVFRSGLIRGRTNKNLWEYEPIKNRWIFSSFDITRQNLPSIIKQLRKVAPKYLHVYPSVLTILAAYIKEHNEPPIDSVKGILSGSENTYPSQIRLFEEVFNCEVFRWYGLGELSAIAGSCELSHNYHCSNTYSYTELIDENGMPVTKPGVVGEIVGTTIDNYSMPLIRYRTGDHAVYSGEFCERCGRWGLMFKEIEGREQERIVDNEGNILSLGPYIFGIHTEIWAKISSIQFLQERSGELTIYAVSNNLSSFESKRIIKNYFQNKFDGNFNVTVELTDKTYRTPAGKHPYLIQKLKLEEFTGCCK